MIFLSHAHVASSIDVAKNAVSVGLVNTDMSNIKYGYDFNTLVSFGCLACSLAASIIYWDGAFKTYQDIYLMSFVWIFFCFCAVERMVTYFKYRTFVQLLKNIGSFIFRTVHVPVNEKDLALPGGATSTDVAAAFTHFTAWACAIAYLTISAVAMFAWSNTLSSVARNITFSSLCGIFVLAVYQITFVFQTRTAAGAIATGAPLSSTMRIKLTPAATNDIIAAAAKSVRPLQFGPTGSTTYNASSPDYAILNAIDKKVAESGAKYGLSIKNYAVLQEGESNNYLILKKEHAASFLSMDSTSDVGRTKYGLLGNHKPGGIVAVDDALKETLQGVSTAAPTSDQYVPHWGKYNVVYPNMIQYHRGIMGYGVGAATWLPIPGWFVYLFFLADLAVGCQIFRDAGVSVAVAMITIVPTLLAGLLGPENGMFSLMAFNKVYGVGVILASKFIYPSNEYVLDTDIMHNTAHAWLQNSAFVSPGEAGEFQYLSWFLFSNVCAFMIMESYFFVEAYEETLVKPNAQDSTNKSPSL